MNFQQYINHFSYLFETYVLNCLYEYDYDNISLVYSSNQNKKTQVQHILDGSFNNDFSRETDPWEMV